MRYRASILSNPIEIVAKARKRIARLAVIRIVLVAAFPFGVTVAIAIALNRFNGLAFDNFGYLMDGVRARLFQSSLLLLVLIEMLLTAVLGWRAWLYNFDFIRTAEQIDLRTDGKQEIVTLASLSSPVGGEVANMPSPLFPLLWARVAASLERFEPRTAFVLGVREPLLRSIILAAVAVIILATAAFALMTRPRPEQLVTHRLELLANTIAAADSPTPQLAAAARDVAKDLANPKLPPQQKIAELRALEHELQRFQPPHQGTHQGQGNSSGNSRGNGNGGGEGGGSGSASGKSSGSSALGSGAGKGDSASQQLLELHNDIAKARMKLEQQTASGPRNTSAENNSSRSNGATPNPGTNPRQLAGQDSSNGTGQVSQPQTLAHAKSSSGQGPGPQRNYGGSMGDTHLGEFPKPGNYQRFYKLGENGPPITIRDARYVTFRLPTETESSDGGAIVPDNARLRATTPYTNAPLKQQRLPISPDEQQLVPPRYRGLIR
jgi:uncharacterized membrane protein YgcG